MKRLWLTAAMAVSVGAMQLPASAAPVNGIPAPHGNGGVHGIIIHPCRGHRCCHWYHHHRHCGPLGIGPIGRPIGRKPIGVVGHPVGVVTRPTGVETHGIPVEGVATHGGPVGGPAHGGIVNGIPVEQHGQH